MAKHTGSAWRCVSFNLGFLASIAVAGCAISRPVTPSGPSHYRFQVAAPASATFDRILRAGLGLNLNVQVLEKSSGLIRFEQAALSAAQLDQYCQYPYVNAQSGAPWDTFTGWNVRSLQGGSGPVSGSVSLTVLVSEVTPDSSDIEVRGNWRGGNASEMLPLNSRLTLEHAIEHAAK